MSKMPRNAAHPQTSREPIATPDLFRIDHRDLSEVSDDELSFAMSLFVAAGNRRLQRPVTDPPGAHEVLSRQESRHILRQLCADAVAPAPSQGAHAAQHTTLEAAFLCLWRHYEGDPCRLSICARVVGFHLLMVRTEGTVLESWVCAEEETPELVSLHPAVVSALASVPMLPPGLLPEEIFLQRIAFLAGSDAGAGFLHPM